MLIMLVNTLVFSFYFPHSDEKYQKVLSWFSQFYIVRSSCLLLVTFGLVHIRCLVDADVSFIVMHIGCCAFLALVICNPDKS